MTYDEMLQGLADAGHDVSGYKRPPVTTKSASPTRKPDAILVTLNLNDVAGVVDEAIAAATAPLEQRLYALEQRLAALEATLQPQEPAADTLPKGLRRVV